MRKIKMPRTAQSTTPGRENPNRQQVIARTGNRSAVRSDQTVYHLRCGLCGHHYGAPGIDIEKRLCPQCQGGVAGEPLPERPAGPGLFDGLA